MNAFNSNGPCRIVDLQSYVVHRFQPLGHVVEDEVTVLQQLKVRRLVLIFK